MSDNVWSSTGSTDGNAAANWSLGAPGATHRLVFDATSAVNCTFTAALNVAGISAAATYAGNLDLGDGFTHQIGASGIVFDHLGNLDLGISTYQFSGGGALDWKDVGGTLTTGYAHLRVLSGSTTWRLRCAATAVDYIASLTISTGATLTIAPNTVRNYPGTFGLVDIAGTLELQSDTLFYLRTGGDLKIRPGGNLSGTGSMLLYAVESPGGISQQDGTINVTISILLVTTTSPKFVPCTINGTLNLLSYAAGTKFKPDAGTITIANDVYIEATAGSTLTIDLTNGTTLTIAGELSSLTTDGTQTITAAGTSGQLRINGDISAAGAGTWTYTPGTVPILALTGTADQLATIPGTTALEIDKSAGKVTPVNAWTHAVTITAGTLELTDAYTHQLGAIDIAAAGTLIVASGNHNFDGMDNSGTVTIATGAHIAQYTSATNGIIHNRTGATITGAGILGIGFQAGTTKGLQTQAGTIDVAVLWAGAWDGLLLCPGTYASPQIRIYDGNNNDHSLQFAGTYDFAGTLRITTSYTGTTTIDLATAAAQLNIAGNLQIDILSTGDLEIDCTAQASRLIVAGNIIDNVTGGGGGSLTWAKGTSGAELTLTGSGNQAIDIPATGIGHVQINKSAGTVTLGGALDCESLTILAGTLDPNGQEITTAAECTILLGANFPAAADAMNGSAWTIGGNLNWRGSSITPLRLNATGAWTLDVTGRAYVLRGEVAYCDASGGQQITGAKCTDNDDNDNWRFTDGGGQLQALILP